MLVVMMLTVMTKVVMTIDTGSDSDSDDDLAYDADHDAAGPSLLWQSGVDVYVWDEDDAPRKGGKKGDLFWKVYRGKVVGQAKTCKGALIKGTYAVKFRGHEGTTDYEFDRMFISQAEATADLDDQLADV